ncbi:MAG: hypothetical protein ACE5G9_05650 [Nitrospinales bacterium]
MPKRIFLIIVGIMTQVVFASIGYAQYECVRGDCINGTGKLAVKDSAAYLEGRFVNGVHVEGKVVFPSGTIFQGIFKDHKLVQGTKKFANGQTLQGKFIENVLVDGIFTDANGVSRPVKLKPLDSKK